MKLADFNIGRDLRLTFAILIGLILGGNALLLWQFRSARLQTERLTGVSQQMFEVLRLQPSVLAFHQQLDELLKSRDARHLVAEGGPLRRTLLQQTQRTRNALTQLPPEIRIDPAFLPTLETIELTLPSQLDTALALAASGDWDAVSLRLAKQLNPIETETADLVESLDREVSGELAQAVANMRSVQSRINILVPATAICTFFIAAFFGRAVTRRVILLRTEERINERMRIARDFHDTLLQNFHGVLMMLSAVSYRIKDPPEAKEQLETIVKHVRKAVNEGRDAVQGLRSFTVITNDLARSISTFGEELCADRKGQDCPEFRVIVDGTSRDLLPLVRDEVHRIACEALRNAFRHAQARRIDVEIQYDRRQLVLKVQDQGKGVDPAVLDAGGREGHYGLRGMQERATLVGGQLAILSKLDAGTEIELTIPASVAYVKSRNRSMASGQ